MGNLRDIRGVFFYKGIFRDMIYCSHVAHALQVSRGASSDFHVHTPDVQKTQSRIDWNWGGRVVGLSRWSSVQLPMLTGQKQSKRQSALQLMKICCTHNSYRLTWSASRLKYMTRRKRWMIVVFLGNKYLMHIFCR